MAPSGCLLCGVGLGFSDAQLTTRSLAHKNTKIPALSPKYKMPVSPRSRDPSPIPRNVWENGHAHGLCLSSGHRSLAGDVRAKEKQRADQDGQKKKRARTTRVVDSRVSFAAVQLNLPLSLAAFVRSSPQLLVRPKPVRPDTTHVLCCVCRCGGGRVSCK